MVALMLPLAQVQPPYGMDVTHNMFGLFGIAAMVLITLVLLTTDSRNRADVIRAFVEFVRVVVDGFRGQGRGPDRMA